MNIKDRRNFVVTEGQKPVNMAHVLRFYIFNDHIIIFEFDIQIDDEEIKEIWWVFDTEEDAYNSYNNILSRFCMDV